MSEVKADITPEVAAALTAILDTSLLIALTKRVEATFEESMALGQKIIVAREPVT